MLASCIFPFLVGHIHKKVLIPLFKVTLVVVQLLLMKVVALMIREPLM